MIRRLGKIDDILMDFARSLEKVNDKYNCRFSLGDNTDSSCVRDDKGEMNDTIVNELTKSFRKIIKDKDLYLEEKEPNNWYIVSDKLDYEFEDHRGLIAVRSKDKYMLVRKNEFLYYDYLEETSLVLIKDDVEYLLYIVDSDKLEKEFNRLEKCGFQVYDVDENLIKDTIHDYDDYVILNNI